MSGGAAMKRSGFTLIELMVVVGIMILIATIVVTGSFGMSRASSYLAAENVVYNTLQAARQKACTDGKPVIVAFVKREESGGDESYALVTVQAAGTISDVDSTYFYDRGALFEGYSLGRNKDDSVWNLTTGACAEGPFEISYVGYGKLTPKPIPGFSGHEYGYDVTQIKFDKALKGNLWKPGQTYGFQVGEMQELPLGFKFGWNSADGSPEGQMVVFKSDGTSSYGKAGNIGNEGDVSIYISEEMKNNNSVPVKITVSKGGVIKVEK